MNITALNFYLLLTAVLVIYYILPYRFQNYCLLIISYAFHITWAWQFSLVLFTLTAINYFIALSLHRNERNQPAFLWLGIVLNVAALIFFRVADYFLPGLMSLLSSLGVPLSQYSLKILLPIGLAYYTLQNISYLVDVYRKQITASTNFVDFATYLAYFPKILSGPIERAHTFLPALAQPRRINNKMIARGLTLIITGLIRKLFVAGLLSAIIYWDAFETPNKYTGPELIGWIVIYSFFLYSDFTGYTSIARGISCLFGVELSPNFKQPYFTRSMAEFWNSWHISLTHWLRDYIYFPTRRTLLKRNRDQYHPINLILPPMVTMLVSGLWHGLGWKMMLWGGLHGLFLAGERFLSLHGPVIPSHLRPFWRQCLAAIVVFILVSLTWVPFIMEPSAALVYWRGMFDWTYPTIRYRRMLLFIPILIVILAVDWLERHYQDETFILRWPGWTQAVLLAFSFFLLGFLMQANQQDPFIYQGF